MKCLANDAAAHAFAAGLGIVIKNGPESLWAVLTRSNAAWALAVGLSLARNSQDV
jgi:hypothetical protein